MVSEVVMPGRGQSMADASGATVEDVVPGRFGRRAPRRRPSGAPPPLPRHLRTTGAGWLIAAVVAIFVTALVFRNGVSGAAITVIDRRRHCRAVDERHRSAGHPRHRPGRELCGVVVGHRDHGLAAGRGADRLPAMASPGDLPGGVTGRAAGARVSVRPDHPAPSFRGPVARELGRLVAALDPDAVARWAVGHCSVHAGARGAGCAIG